MKRMQIGQLPTAQEKIISVGKKAGVSNLANQQGSTRVLYDTISLDGRTTFEFFKNPQAAVNSLGSVLGSNIDSSQGLLGPGEALAIEFISFQFMKLTAASSSASVTKFDTIQNNGTADISAGFYAGDFSVMVANQQIVKPVSCAVFKPEFNYTITGAFDSEIFKMMTKAVILPNLQLQINLQVPPYVSQAAGFAYIRCTIQGVGSLLNLNETL